MDILGLTVGPVKNMISHQFLDLQVLQGVFPGQIRVLVEGRVT